jgi:hypothetical protein
MSELYDYVDRDDNVMGQTTFEDAREKGRIIRVVHNWVLKPEGGGNFVSISWGP